MRASHKPFHIRINSGSGKFLPDPFSFAARFMRIARFLAIILIILAAAEQFAAAQQWQRLGPQGGTVMSLASSDGAVYLGTADGHVFASQDYGEHWELRGRAGERVDGVIQRLVTDTAHKERVLAAVWFRDAPGGGVFESVDGARHWKAAGLQGEVVRALEQSPSQPKVWVAGTRNGVFRSEDDARSWQKISPVNDPELQDIDSLAIDPRDVLTLYVGTYHLPWKTVDGGKTWHPIAEGMIDDSDIMSLRIDTHNPRRIFSSACSGIYRSEDAGAHWVKLQGIPYSSRRTQQIAQDPGDEQVLYAATTQGLWMTADSGETWSRVTGRETSANAVVLIHNGRGSRVLAGFDTQGVLRSDDRGSNFVDSNEGFSHQVIQSAATDADGRELMVLTAGVSGRLTMTQDAGRSWHDVSAHVPGKTAERVFSAAPGWYLGFAQGGLAQFDRPTGAWRELRFRDAAKAATVPRTRARRTRREASRGAWRFIAPRVRAIVSVSNRLFAATEDGLWVRSPGPADFRRAVVQNLPRNITFLMPTPDNSLLAIADGALWSGNAQEANWKRLKSPSETASPLWVEDLQWKGAAARLLGTSQGVYVSQSDADWRLLGYGLPAIASQAIACSNGSCLAAMSMGALYETKPGEPFWNRMGSEAGLVLDIVGVGGTTFLVITRSDGVLKAEPKG